MVNYQSLLSFLRNGLVFLLKVDRKLRWIGVTFRCTQPDHELGYRHAFDLLHRFTEVPLVVLGIVPSDH